MTHVSHRKLSDADRKALYTEFVKSMERSFDQEKGFLVFSEFLTHTEREMFAKRFAVIVMLERKVPGMVIAEALKMSPVTVSLMSVKYKSGRYESVLKYALDRKDVWEIIENIISAGGILPPMAGKGRWKHFQKDARKARLRNS